MPLAPTGSESFLFALDIGKRLDARKTHIRRLYDVMYLCIQRHDIPRALRAWTVLSRCKEIDGKTMWPLAVHLLSESTSEKQRDSVQLDFLRDAMLQNSNDRQDILKELVHRLLSLNKPKEALDELELYLPAFPYQDNPVLHLYAGLISLHLSTSDLGEEHNDINGPSYAREAQAHLERAIRLNPNDLSLQAYKQKFHRFLQKNENNDGPDSEEDLDSVEIRAKRPCR